MIVELVIEGYMIRSSFERMATGKFGCVSIYKNFNRSKMVPVKVVIDKSKSEKMRKLEEFKFSPYYDMLTTEQKEQIESEITKGPK